MKTRFMATLAIAGLLVAASFGQDSHRRQTTRTTTRTHSVTHTSRSGGPQVRNRHQNTYSHTRTFQSSHSDRNWNSNRTFNGNRNSFTGNHGSLSGGHDWNGNRSHFNENNRTFTQSRPNRIFGGGEHFRPMDWRRDHPGWNGHLYYHFGHYYFDPGFSVVADIDNEWNAIAAISGGVAILGALDNDPYLVFAGDVGELYAFSLYNGDLYSSDPVLRLRAEFFSRPYFWRDGIRYDRHVVEEGGHRFYQFRRH